MFPGEISLHEVVREYLMREDYNTTVTDDDICSFISEDNFTSEILQGLVSVAYRRGAMDASALVGV